MEGNASHNEPTEKTDARLVYEAVEGDSKAFGLLVERYKNLVSSFVAARVAGGVVDDLAQETFLRAFRVLPSLRDPAAFSSWLLGIASHICIDWHRARKPLVSLDADETPEPGEQIGPRRSPPSRPDQLAEAKEAAQRVLESLDKLPETYRITLVLKHLDGLTCSQIARRLGVALGTVTSRLARGYKMLREQLDDPPETLRKSAQ